MPPLLDIRELHTEFRTGAGVVRAVEVDGFLARVELDITAPARVVAIITREATEELRLRPGQEAVAVVKSTSVMVER